LNEKSNLIVQTTRKKRQSFIGRLSSGPGKTETKVSQDIPGDRKAEKFEMFHAAKEQIVSEEPSCSLYDTPSGKANRKEDRRDSRRMKL